MQGTWADHVIVSVEIFPAGTLVQASNMIQSPRSVYIGHR